MYRNGDSWILSPSDLNDFLECGHLTELERQVAVGTAIRPVRDDPEQELLVRHGDLHEFSELSRMEASGLHIVKIDAVGSAPDELLVAERTTLDAMQRGADVIYQATFFDGLWRGHADFLLRVEEPSAFGSWRYEAADAKLSRRARASALVQTACYSEHVARLQGVWPQRMTIITGDGGRHRYQVEDVVSYVRNAKDRFMQALALSEATSYPLPVQYCRNCAWQESCEAKRRSDDHLSLVARIRSDQLIKLERAGVPTMASLAQHLPAVPRMGRSTVERLHQQARLQVAARQDGKLRYELTHAPSGVKHGLEGLPAPSSGDLFVDFEGDPWVGEHGLEYLFGVLMSPTDQNPDPEYLAIWAHNSTDERAGFERFIDCIIDRLDADPEMHVYHYAPYEMQAMKKLMSLYGTREDEVDRLLRGEVMVDLYRTVSQGVRCSLESYGLKKLEAFYWPHRDAAIADGAASVIAYEQWRNNGDKAILQELEAYNELDCRSTLALRDWLESLRIELEIEQGAPIPRFPLPALVGAPDGDNKRAADVEQEPETTELVSDLLIGVSEVADERDDRQQARWLLAQLVDWHRREAKPKWWAWFERLSMTDEELVLDHESIGDITYLGAVGSIAKSLVHRYRFDPSQEFKIADGDSLFDPRTGLSAGTVIALDRSKGTVDLKRGVTSKAPHPSSLVPRPPIADTPLRQGIVRVARWVADNDFDAEGPHRAVRDFLINRTPRFGGLGAQGALVGPEEYGSDAAVRLAPLLDDSYLAVQGPPGSGKTHTGARLVLALVRAGNQVGITAHSHKAIDNLVEAVCLCARDEAVTLRIARKINSSDRESLDNGDQDAMVRLESDNGAIESLVASGDVDIVAGTAWLMAREAMGGRLHTLVVDEAGQMSLANLLAVSSAAANLVLLGDPRQLAQPTQAIHPVGAEVSSLDHLLAGSATIGPDRGVFLEHSFRMHPDICDFVSDLAYDKRLQPTEGCGNLRIQGNGVVPDAGLAWLPVQHEGCRTSSPEEVRAVAATIDQLIGCEFTGRDGLTRPLDPSDVMVIAPYNAQVALLREKLADSVRVGTVDRFQGQEAAVVIYCLSASSAQDIPRGLGFLFSPNRFNVALSRAQALAVVVGCPTLLSTRCQRPEQLRLVNVLCRYVEAAQLVDLGVLADRPD